METESVQKNMNGKSQGMVQPAKPMEPAMPEEMEKMSLFKKWWFWAIVGGVFVILLLILFFYL
jgi:hypothetical protein